MKSFENAEFTQCGAVVWSGYIINILPHNKETGAIMKWNEGDLDKYDFFYYRRACIASQYLSKEDLNIVDYGCGRGHIKGFLPEGAHYTSIDRTKRFSDTIVVDLDTQTPSITADAAVLLGILEYIQNKEKFLEVVLCNSKKIIMSYSNSNMLEQSHLIEYILKNDFILTGYSTDLDNYFIGCFEKTDLNTFQKNIMCTACRACEKNCPTKSITISENDAGLMKMVINSNTCTKCNRCIKTCPITGNKTQDNQKQPECYAFWAPDNIRIDSTSGGAFSALANHVIKNKGIVFGATWKPSFKVTIDYVETIPGIKDLAHSKYVRCDTANSYNDVRQFLEKDETVLYSGCPCQIAGLKRYLGKDYDNLYTVEIICNGVSPVRCLVKYIENKGDNISKISFRDKTKWGKYNHTLFYEDGSFSNNIADEYEWMFFSKNRDITEECCNFCQFTSIPRIADISIGDFWGIEKHDPSWNDLFGTSLVLLNSEKGKHLFESNTCIQRKEKIDLQLALTHNRIGPFKRVAKKPSDFIHFLDCIDFHKNMLRISMKKYDVGILGMFNNNYGNTLTYFSLFNYIKNSGYSVLMIDCPKESTHRKNTKTGMFYKFASNPYKYYEFVDKYETLEHLRDLNRICDQFVLGSDQSIRPDIAKYHGNYAFMTWVEDDKNKTAYAASIGSVTELTNMSPDDIKTFKDEISRIDNLSVREPSTVDAFSKYLGQTTHAVLDPVFLTDVITYREMSKIGIGRIPKGEYVGAYIRMPRGWKYEKLQKYCDKLKCQCKIVSDAYDYTNRDDLKFIPDAFTEEWLALIDNSNCFFTDSFHGTCFAIIFRKQFLVFLNNHDERIEGLLDLVGLRKRIIFENTKNIEKTMEEIIDYDVVYEKLSNKLELDKKWLIDSLNKKKPKNDV